MPISPIGGYYEYSVNSEKTGNQELDKDAFLNLMVTELKYQDPMNPMDNTEYVAQLAQFSSLEQLYNVNENLSDNAFLTQSMHNSIVSSMIGKEITAASSAINYAGDETDLNFTLADEADVTISIFTESGDLVKTIDLGHLDSGNQDATWDGSNFTGASMPEGTYYMDIVASDPDGNSIAAIPMFKGIVTGLKYNDGNPVFVVGEAEISVSEILEINQANNSENEE